jgi:integrase/recombinase XerD
MAHKLLDRYQVHPHVLRHTFARSLLDKGVDLVTVQQLMGHKRVDSTARYTKPSERDMEVAVARLELEEV